MKKLLFAIYFSATLIFLATPVANTFAATPTPKATETTQASESTSTAVEEVHSEETTEKQGVVGLFGLDWKLFLAQLINFAIVLFVLWKWVFTPVVNSMQDRAKKIEDSLVNSERIEKEKLEFESWKTNEINKARNEAGTIISEAKATAQQTKQQILDQAKQEQQEVIDKAKQELEREKNKIVQDAKAEIANMVVSSTEKLLRTKIDQTKDSELINSAIKEMQ